MLEDSSKIKIPKGKIKINYQKAFDSGELNEIKILQNHVEANVSLKAYLGMQRPLTWRCSKVIFGNQLLKVSRTQALGAVNVLE